MPATITGRHTIELASGRYLNLSDPDPAAITLQDVAHGLSHTCRFAGQCLELYSVCEHALLVAARLEDLGCDAAVCLAGLHHDDAEAFIGDPTQPLKRLVPHLATVEASVLAAVIDALELTGIPLNDPAVKTADRWALAQEAYWLMPSQGRSWSARQAAGGPLPWPLGLAPDVARRTWLTVHRILNDIRIPPADASTRLDGQAADRRACL